MLVQHVAQKRAADAGLSSIANLHDTANAFHCIPTERLREGIRHNYKDGLEDLQLDMLDQAATALLTCEETLAVLKRGSGQFMGEVSATEDFTQATLPILAEWQRRNLETLPHAKAMWTRCPVTDQPHDISLTGFVDDVCKRTLFLTIAEAVRGVAQNDANQEKAMTPDGYAQNAKNNTAPG